MLIENNYKQRNIKVANEIIKKISYEFGGSELDLIRDTIIEELNNDCKKRYLDMVDNFSTHIVNNIVSFHKDKVNFDYVFNKIYTIFNDPLLCEMVFNSVSDKLEKEHNILIEKLEVKI